MKKFQWYILAVLILGIGFFIGNNFSVTFLKIKTDGISLDQLLTTIVTIGVGWYIPSKLSKVLEDKRVIKNLLVEEISTNVSFIKNIKIIINKCYTIGAIQPSDKMEINLLFEESDLLLSNLQKQTEIIDNTLCNESIHEYHQYWTLVTGGNLMNSSYTVVDRNFNSEVIIEHYKLEIAFKRLAQMVQMHS
jgi:hypothetical protein